MKLLAVDTKACFFEQIVVNYTTFRTEILFSSVIREPADSAKSWVIAAHSYQDHTNALLL